mmetsp:Transcript_26822/g.64594  ORF Transcript_26822/g.64594 Transcript_26822/m.64594 type:complete len:255 (+) Transcript_26822:202-966(+)
MAAKKPSDASSFSGGPLSTNVPSLITNTTSLVTTVSSRCAMVTIVQAANSRLIITWMPLSVSPSTLLVGSSKHKIFRGTSSARAKHMSCFSPELNPAPELSTARFSSCWGSSWAKPVLSSAASTLASPCSPHGSRLLLTVPFMSTGSWGMAITARRSRSKPIPPSATPSIRTHPSQGSTSLKRHAMRLLLPLPVRPTTPAFWPPSIVNDTPFRANGKSGLYLILTSSYCKVPFAGQDSGASSNTTRGGSCSTSR